MYLPRNIISHLYTHLLRTQHASSPPVLLLVSLDPDALCACRILTALFKRDYIAHKIQPISGYADFRRAGVELVRPMRTQEGGSGGTVVCLGVGGLVDVESELGFEALEGEDRESGMGGVDVWLMDARRPFELANVFDNQLPVLEEDGALVVQTERGVENGRVSSAYTPGRGGVFVFDDGDIEDYLAPERESYYKLKEIPDLGAEEGITLDQEGDEAVAESEIDDDEERIPDSAQPGQKRKSSSQEDLDSDSDADEGTPRKRMRSNSVRTLDHIYNTMH